MKHPLPPLPAPPSPADLAERIDHTLLRPDAVRAEVAVLCDEAIRYGFRAVCLHPVFVSEARRRLEGSGSRVCTVVGFPLGAEAPGIKAAAARQAIEDGAQDIDMVLFLGGLKAGETARVRDDIRSVVEVCRAGRALCKVILETCLLTDGEKGMACDLCVEAGADFVKTSTGFSSGGATVEDVVLMTRRVSPHGLGVKASGGIGTREDAIRMLKAGASVVGASRSLSIVSPAGAPSPAGG